MRTLGILEMFKKCPKPVSSQKAPLLLYCDALMQSSQAFKPVSLEEACECTKCVLELGTGDTHSVLTHNYIKWY